MCSFSIPEIMTPSMKPQKVEKQKNIKYIDIQKYLRILQIVMFKSYSNRRSFSFENLICNCTDCLVRLNLKSIRNSVNITIYPQTILNICYSKSISRRYLKISPVQFFLLVFEVQILTKIRIIHKKFYITFEVQILTKICQNHEYLPLKHKPLFSPTIRNDILGPRLTNHLRSESFSYTMIPIIGFKFNTPIIYNSDPHGT
ncbi:hypothetical protein AGLY_015083 [Aphis glycines]|uniref:Uncharacterized protein n=1 Tax=Aphis glycines TaxID=307491 RepID=A0A6G0T2C0_APHGL|nr:hypothetical protein AGLY_015083 [Aphis glycines]